MSEHNPARMAHDRLAGAFTLLGYTLSPTSGVINGIKVHDASGRYLFAWHPHQNHVLFYFRKPALDAGIPFRQLAIEHHPTECVRENPGGETLVTLYTDDDARDLLEWLCQQVPL